MDERETPRSHWLWDYGGVCVLLLWIVQQCLVCAVEHYWRPRDVVGAPIKTEDALWVPPARP